MIIYIDYLLFAIVAFAATYLLLFSTASLFSHSTPVESHKRQLRFIVLILAHRQDKTVLRTVNSVLGQSYAQRQFDVTVISDHQQEMTNMRLAQLPVTLLTPNLKDYTKTKLLQYAIVHLPRFKQYDTILILNGDCFVDTDFLEQLNNAYLSSGSKCVQTHHVTSNRDNNVTRLEAVAEEINNSVFRRGHVALGLSSSLCAAGMVYDFNWFVQNITKVHAANEEKEMEAMLIHDRIFIDYVDYIHIYAEKPHQERDFNHERNEWSRLQRRAFISNLRFLPMALLHRQYDMLDKLIQWLIVPRTTMMAIIMLMDVVTPFIRFTMAIKWWVLSSVVLLAFALAVPNYLVDKHWNRTFLYAPLIVYKRFLRKPKQLYKKLINGNPVMAVHGLSGRLLSLLRRGKPAAETEE